MVLINNAIYINQSNCFPPDQHPCPEFTWHSLNYNYNFPRSLSKKLQTFKYNYNIHRVDQR